MEIPSHYTLPETGNTFQVHHAKVKSYQSFCLFVTCVSLSSAKFPFCLTYIYPNLSFPLSSPRSPSFFYFSGDEYKSYLAPLPDFLTRILDCAIGTFLSIIYSFHVHPNRSVQFRFPREFLFSSGL
jgi:hypothetical protein